jgi:hypothetical protein
MTAAGKTTKVTAKVQNRQGDRDCSIDINSGLQEGGVPI